jgi:hypothetical protein
VVWLPAGDLPVGFDETIFSGVFVGEQLIKVEHGFNGSSFPGTGYAIISNLFFNGEREFFRRSYPYKGSPRLYRITAPQQFNSENYQIYQLTLRRSARARVDADADWRVRIFRWAEAGELEAIE